MDLPPERLTIPSPESMIEEIRTLELGRLEERVAVFRRIPQAPDGGPGARLGDCEELITELRLYLRKNRRRLALIEPATLRRYLGLLAHAADSDIDAYPSTRLSLVVLKAETLILVGQPGEALALVAPMAENLHSLEGDFDGLAGVYLQDAAARLAVGDVQALGRVGFNRFATAVNWRPWRAWWLFWQWHPALGIGPMWRRGGCGVAEFIVVLCARARLAARGGAWWRFDRLLLRLFVAGFAVFVAGLMMLLLHPRRALQVQLDTPPVAGTGPRDVLVSRVVDNVGDIVLMLPGLAALAARLRRPVWLATRPEFAPLLNDNPDVRLLDVTQPLGVGGFRYWANLSLCPAAGYEARMRPVVRRGRVQLFARAMGVGRLRLWRSGMVPRVRLSASQQATRTAVRAGSALVVGLHGVGRDSSRAAPWVTTVNVTTPGARTLLLDTSTATARREPAARTMPLGRMPLADAVAVVAACDYLVAVDDWVLQLGAALGIPTLAIAGPSMTRRLSRHHPRLHLLEPPEYLPCRPCWRTASQPCVLTGLRRSACLAPPAHEGVQAALEKLIAAYPKKTESVPTSSPSGTSVEPYRLSSIDVRSHTERRDEEVVHPVTRAVRDALRYVELEVIAEKLEALRRVPLTPSGYAAFRPQDCRVVIQALEKFLLTNITWFEAGSQDLGKRFLDLVDRLAAAGLRAYPNEALQLELVRAKALVALGRESEALAVLGPMVARPYLVEGDMSSLATLLELHSQALLSLGRLHEVRRNALARVLMIVRLQPWQATRMFDHLMNGLAVGRRLADRPRLVEPVLRLTARLRLHALMLGWRKRIWQNRTRYLATRAAEFSVAFVGRQMLFLIALNRRPRLLSSVSDDAAPPGTGTMESLHGSWLQSLRNLLWDRRPVLVTRAMGGIGDIMTMTPGMAALARRMGQPVHFATRRVFHPLLENNPSIKLLDIEQPVDGRQYRRWVNLSFCPAAEYEASVWPRVRKGRVQLYARSMGIRRSGLRPVGWLPRCYLSAAQEEVRDKARARFAETGLPAIAVQHYARELYRSYPAMTETIRDLADEAVIVVFHTSAIPLPQHPNVIPMLGRPLGESIATLAACDYYLGVDSAFFHVAVAFGLPCLGLFGPTSGMVRTSGRHYPNVRLMPHAQRFTCAPCWRNEDMPCYVSGGQASTCLTSTQPLALADEMRRLMRDYPKRRSTVVRSVPTATESALLGSI